MYIGEKYRKQYGHRNSEFCKQNSKKKKITPPHQAWLFKPCWNYNGRWNIHYKNKPHTLPRRSTWFTSRILKSSKIITEDRNGFCAVSSSIPGRNWNFFFLSSISSSRTCQQSPGSSVSPASSKNRFLRLPTFLVKRPKALNSVQETLLGQAF